ncbi:DRTGG domain-containing protein [Allofustis seminis]|uniref:DRTGG domain-containing protein n=1 Tax=Allofustis seminis TaxID=166939 RepID=UPI000362A1EB|nr:DRTGG domain-containing protein [Allofustis seminis]
MTTKHQQLLNYIEEMPVGAKLSVRKIARQFDVSEGTAYRAIKEAENQGLLKTVQRVGTVRTEPPQEPTIDTLTLKEVLNVAEGTILGGEEGLDRPLKKFVIGAMELAAMERYISEGSLVIVGNREDAQRLALEKGAAILITGGFEASRAVTEFANKKKLPLMSTTYDTFTVATKINRAITDQLIQKEIVQVESIYTSVDRTMYLKELDTVADYKKLNERSKHSRFPVIDKNNRVIGVVSPKDIIHKEDNVGIFEVMSIHPQTVHLRTNVAAASHKMIWEGYELMPVIDDEGILKGVVSRQDVMKAMQSIQQQSQVSNTISDQINQAIDRVNRHEYSLKVTPQMTNTLGTASIGVLAEAVTCVIHEYILPFKNNHYMIEDLRFEYLQIIQIGQELTLVPEVYFESRRSIRINVDIYAGKELVARSISGCQLFSQNI